MADIRVHGSDGEYEVSVSEGGSSTSHRVTLSSEDFDRLANGSESPEELITRSFEFLLAREPKESILKSFDLTVIGQYFPEYEDTI